MEVLFILGFAVFTVWAVSNLGKATVTYVNPRSTQEKLEEAHHANNSVLLALLILVVFIFMAAGGAFTTGISMEKLERNGSWILTGEGEYRR